MVLHSAAMPACWTGGSWASLWIAVMYIGKMRSNIRVRLQSPIHGHWQLLPCFLPFFDFKSCSCCRQGMPTSLDTLARSLPLRGVCMCVCSCPTSGLRARGGKMQGGGDGARRGDGRRRLTSYFQTSWADVSRQLFFCQPLPNRMLVNCENSLDCLEYQKLGFLV